MVTALSSRANAFDDGLKLAQATLIRMPVRQNVTVVIGTMIAPAIRIKIDVGVGCIHDAIRADSIGHMIFPGAHET
jgi:hypothetical protein